MSLRQWAENGWVEALPSSAQEIGNLFSIVDRDIEDSHGRISADWRFGIAYNAGLKLALILMRAEAFKPDRASSHYRTIQAIPIILGEEFRADADYLDSCRSKRNIVEYDVAGAATFTDADELVEFVTRFRNTVREWLARRHPELCS